MYFQVFDILVWCIWPPENLHVALNSIVSYQIFTISSIPAYHSRCLTLYSTPIQLFFFWKQNAFSIALFSPEPSALKILQLFLYGNYSIRQNTEP